MTIAKIVAAAAHVLTPIGLVAAAVAIVCGIARRRCTLRAEAADSSCTGRHHHRTALDAGTSFYYGSLLRWTFDMDDGAANNFATPRSRSRPSPRLPTSQGLGHGHARHRARHLARGSDRGCQPSAHHALDLHPHMGGGGTKSAKHRVTVPIPHTMLPGTAHFLHPHRSPWVRFASRASASLATPSSTCARRHSASIDVKTVTFGSSITRLGIRDLALAAAGAAAVACAHSRSRTVVVGAPAIATPRRCTTPTPRTRTGRRCSARTSSSSILPFPRPSTLLPMARARRPSPRTHPPGCPPARSQNQGARADQAQHQGAWTRDRQRHTSPSTARCLAAAVGGGSQCAAVEFTCCASRLARGRSSAGRCPTDGDAVAGRCAGVLVRLDRSSAAKTRCSETSRRASARGEAAAGVPRQGYLGARGFRGPT